MSFIRNENVSKPAVLLLRKKSVRDRRKRERKTEKKR